MSASECLWGKDGQRRALAEVWVRYRCKRTAIRRPVAGSKGELRNDRANQTLDHVPASAGGDSLDG